MDQFLPMLWEAAKTAGPFGTLLMFTMWWLERTERLDKDKLLLKTIPDVLDAINGMRSSIRTLTALIQGRNGVPDDQ